MIRAAEAETDGAHGTVFGFLDAVLGLDVTTITVSTDGPAQTAPNVQALLFHLTRGVTNSATIQKSLVRKGHWVSYHGRQ